MMFEPTGLSRLSTGQLRSARRLKQRKFRLEDQQFLAEGRQAVREALASAACALIVSEHLLEDHKDLIDEALRQGIRVFIAFPEDVDSLCDTVTPQGIVAVCDAVDVPLADAITGAKLVVICAQVRDPGNAGTVIRCADAFGADAVIITSDSVDITNPKCVRATVGSLFHIPIVVGADLAEAVSICKSMGMQVLAADGGGETLTEVDLSVPTAWVMGNEAWGLPAEHKALADHIVGVPMWGQAESLNLSTAAAVCLYATGSAQRS
ncbi:MAG: TrmH family RNA methyltransferase [Propionibacteriaceae bacterium]